MAHRVGTTTELAALLASFDLSAFLAAFVEENLDDRSMFSLREGDLRSLGIPPSARRRFLEAVEERCMDGHSWDALDQLSRPAAGDRDGATETAPPRRAPSRAASTDGDSTSTRSPRSVENTTVFDSHAEEREAANAAVKRTRKAEKNARLRLARQEKRRSPKAADSPSRLDEAAAAFDADQRRQDEEKRHQEAADAALAQRLQADEERRTPSPLPWSVVAGEAWRCTLRAW